MNDLDSRPPAGSTARQKLSALADAYLDCQENYDSEDPKSHERIEFLASLIDPAYQDYEEQLELLASSK